MDQDTGSIMEEVRTHKHVKTQTDDLLKHSNKQKNNKELKDNRIVKQYSSTSAENIFNTMIDVTMENEELRKEYTSYHSVFSDEFASENTKKNKIAVLLSCLTGAHLSSKQEINETNTVLNFEIKPTSIISQHNKPKHSKHVTFNIPEKENTLYSSSVENSTIETIPVTNTTKTVIEYKANLQPETVVKVSDAECDKSNSTGNNVLPNNTKVKEIGKSTSELPELEKQPNKIRKTSLNLEQKPWPHMSGKASEEEHKNIITCGVPLFHNKLSVQTTVSKPGGFKFEFQDEILQSRCSITRTSSVTNTTAIPMFSFTSSSTASAINTQIPPINANVSKESKQSSSLASYSVTYFCSKNTSSNFNNNHKLTDASTLNINADKTSKSILNPLRNIHSARSGANTTVTSAFGTNAIFSTGLEANSTPPVVPPDFNNTASFSKSRHTDINTMQTQVFNKTFSQESDFKISLAKSPTTSGFNMLPSIGFGCLNSDFSVSNSNKTSDNLFSSFSNTKNEPILTNSRSQFASPISTNAAAFINPITTSGLNSFCQSMSFCGEILNQKSGFGMNVDKQTNMYRGNTTSDTRCSNSFNSFSCTTQPATFMPYVSHTSASNSTGSGNFSFRSLSSVASNEVAFCNTSMCGSSSNAICSLTSSPYNPPELVNSFASKFSAPAGVFNIGSGTSNNKLRFQVKTRRKT